MVAFDLSHFPDFEQVKIFSSHFPDFEQLKNFGSHFPNFEQVKFLVVILLTLNNNYSFINFWLLLF